MRCTDGLVGRARPQRGDIVVVCVLEDGKGVEWAPLIEQIVAAVVRNVSARTRWPKPRSRFVQEALQLESSPDSVVLPATYRVTLS
eukprot:SAG31_NODE_10425_length_1140_cov_0.856868_2_plen_86_part_00